MLRLSFLPFVRAAAVMLLACPLPVHAAGSMVLGGVVRTALHGCDAPTPVRGPAGTVYTNVSDCSIDGGRKVSTGWVKVEPDISWVPTNHTAYGEGARGRKLSGAMVEGSTLYVLERNTTARGGMRVGRSPSVAKPSVSWIADLEFGWGSFAQASPDGYEYLYFRDSATAYGVANQIVVARAPKEAIGNLSAWQIFAGTVSAPAWAPWTNRAGRKPILSDPRKVHRAHVTFQQGCWTMAVTMPPSSKGRGGGGLAVYTSANAYGPWSRRYYVTGKDHGESAQFSPLWPGRILLTAADRFEWRSYAMPAGC